MQHLDILLKHPVLRRVHYLLGTVCLIQAESFIKEVLLFLQTEIHMPVCTKVHHLVDKESNGMDSYGTTSGYTCCNRHTERGGKFSNFLEICSDLAKAFTSELEFACTNLARQCHKEVSRIQKYVGK